MRNLAPAIIRARHSNDGLLSLGLAWRGMGGGAFVIPAEVYRKEFDTARRLGIPISVHVSNARERAGQIEALAKENLLGRDVQLVHSIWVTPEEVRAVAAADAAVSVSPYTELHIGFGFPKTGEFLAANVPFGLSIDTTGLSGNADMFAVMKLIQNVENARAESEFKLPARRVLELATIEGARSMGVDDHVGSLRPGKRADLIMVNTRDVNMGVFTDPAHLLVEAAQPANVDTVVVDGRILKRHGRLVAVDANRITADAAAASFQVRKRANW
jgi:5-methylthioadenosine/S-adenosylhomocysteine deaminase